MRTIAIAVVVLGSLAASATARAGDPTPADGDAGLAGLYDTLAPRLAAGAPLVIQVHVPLCDNRVLACGNRKLGDGDRPDGNLYWATDGGFVGWFGRRGSGWTPVALAADARRPDDVLDLRVWHRRVAAAGAWRARGARAALDVYVVAFAWRGTAIDAGLAAYLDDLYGDAARPIALADGTTLDAGAGAAIVAWVGHNRLMDVDPIDWRARAAAMPATARPRGVIAEACQTAPYMAEGVSSATRVPLLMTNDFLFAGAHAFEGVVTAFARGGDLAAMRRAAAVQYAAGEGRTIAHVARAFTNPSDPRWPGPGRPHTRVR
jgi:hypothetical protein